ncbi:MAG TPA: hypothetical protein VJR06_02250, partial [Nitrososphaerales archaeon]|nr:hypothetical protein [Nitrososphaerales archaeon]
VRVFFLYPDFRIRVDDNSSVHFDMDVEQVDPQGNRWLLTFRIFALDRRGRLIIFEHKWPHSYIQTIQRQSVMRDLVEKFAEPLNALPGRIEVR